MSRLGRSDHHRSFVKILPVGLLLHVAKRDASYLHPYVYLTLFLHQDTCTLWNVEQICVENRLHTLGISSSGWDVKKINGSLNLRGWLYSFLSVLYQPLVMALFGLLPGGRSLRADIMSWMWMSTVLTRWLWEREHFLRFSMNDSFPGTFLAFSSWKYAGRAFCRSTGTVYLLLCSISTKTKTAQQTITLDSSLDGFDVHFGRNRSRYDAYDRVPATRPFSTATRCP